MSGIIRSVYLYLAPFVHLRDFYVRTSFVNDGKYESGVLSATLHVHKYTDGPIWKSKNSKGSQHKNCTVQMLILENEKEELCFSAVCEGDKQAKQEKLKEKGKKKKSEDDIIQSTVANYFEEVLFSKDYTEEEAQIDLVLLPTHPQEQLPFLNSFVFIWD